MLFLQYSCLCFCKFCSDRAASFWKLTEVSSIEWYFVSIVSKCALDISKAFDRVDHFALLKVLIDKGLPKTFIDILLEWLRKCNVCVRWGSAYSYFFPILAGVRQGGLLSPISILDEIIYMVFTYIGLQCLYKQFTSFSAPGACCPAPHWELFS